MMTVISEPAHGDVPAYSLVQPIGKPLGREWEVWVPPRHEPDTQRIGMVIRYLGDTAGEYAAVWTFRTRRTIEGRYPNRDKATVALIDWHVTWQARRSG